MTALVQAARRSVAARPSRISWVRRLAAVSASLSVAASVTPEPSRSDGVDAPLAGQRPDLRRRRRGRARCGCSATTARRRPSGCCRSSRRRRPRRPRRPRTSSRGTAGRTGGCPGGRSVSRGHVSRVGRGRQAPPTGVISSLPSPTTPQTLMPGPVRIFATCDIGKAALDRLRERGYEVEVYDELQPPPKALVLEKVRSGIAAPDHDAPRPRSTRRSSRPGPRRGSRSSPRSRSASTTSTARPRTVTGSPTPTPPTSSPTRPPSTPSS